MNYKYVVDYPDNAEQFSGRHLFFTKREATEFVSRALRKGYESVPVRKIEFNRHPSDTGNTSPRKGVNLER